MSKFAHWIVLIIAIGIVVGILSYVLSAFGMTSTSSSVTYNAGGIVCLVFIFELEKMFLTLQLIDHQVLLLAKNQLK